MHHEIDEPGELKKPDITPRIVNEAKKRFYLEPVFLIEPYVRPAWVHRKWLDVSVSVSQSIPNPLIYETVFFSVCNFYALTDCQKEQVSQSLIAANKAWLQSCSIGEEKIPIAGLGKILFPESFK